MDGRDVERNDPPNDVENTLLLRGSRAKGGLSPSTDASQFALELARRRRSSTIETTLSSASSAYVSRMADGRGEVDGIGENKDSTGGGSD